MKLTYKAAMLIAVTLMIAMQFYRPNKNGQRDLSSNDFLIHERAPLKIREMYTNACYDCHSDYTNYEWFDNIAPISWYIDENIKRGVFVLNFSEWKHLSSKQKEIVFSAIPFNIETGRMPQQRYQMFHPKARLTENDRLTMIQWLKQVKARFLLEND